MVPADYAPAAFPSRQQQRDALRKGLGRAVQWASAGRLDDGALLEACLQDQRFDRQVEDPRGEWLWEMVRATGAVTRFRVPILHALHDLSDDTATADQLCGLARQYGSTGDEAFRSRLYEIVEQKPIADSPWLGEEELVGLDGERGFLFAAVVRGRSLAGREWDWDDGTLIDIAAKSLGEGRVHDLLQESSGEAIRRFREGWLQEKQRKAERVSADAHRARMAAIPAEEAIRAAETGGNCSWLPGWGMYADEVSLQTVVRHLRGAREPGVIASLLRVFRRRALPQFDSCFIDFCCHADQGVRRQAVAALRNTAHPLAREFALGELRNGIRSGSEVELFIRNYRAGDEQRILESLEMPEDASELHWLLMGVSKILEANPEANRLPLCLVSYALQPCSSCRCRDARLLIDGRVAPAWLVEECRHDADADCRQLVETAAAT